jgi:hypothetical protein
MGRSLRFPRKHKYAVTSATAGATCLGNKPEQEYAYAARRIHGRPEALTSLETWPTAFVRQSLCCLGVPTWTPRQQRRTQPKSCFTSAPESGESPIRLTTGWTRGGEGGGRSEREARRGDARRMQSWRRSRCLPFGMAWLVTWKIISREAKTSAGSLHNSELGIRGPEGG